MANVAYNSAKKDLLAHNIDLLADPIKVMLVTVAYVPNQDTHTKRSDVTNEVVGTGYTAGGLPLTTKTITQDNTLDRGVFAADNLTWASSTITARGAVMYKSRGGLASADELIAYYDFGGDISSTSAAFLISWNVNGILYLS